MANRYERNPTKQLADGTIVYRTTIYPDIPKRDDDIYAVVQTGDRLDTIAYQFYNDSSLWWIIASANNIHDAVFAVDDGTILRIPRNYLDILQNFKN